MVLSPEEGHRWEDLTISIEQLIRLAARWLLPLTFFSVFPYLLVWGLPAWPDWTGVGEALVSIGMWTVVGLVVYALSAVVHEALHVVAMFVFGGVPPSSIRFGARLSEGVLYVHSDRPMSATAYRIVLTFPAAVQGIVPVGIGTVFGIGWLVLYGYVMIVSAIGDFAVLQLIRHLDSRATVRDHPRKIGCQVRRATG